MQRRMVFIRQYRLLRCVALMLALPALAGCYYMQAVHGQLDIWQKSRPLDDVIDDPRTDAGLAERLRLLRDARRFATERLLLPDNGSYRKYADLERDYVLWNVVAAPEFSLRPRTWCYLVVGCLAYRGYFDLDKAQKLAERLRAQGYDTHTGGVPAYSTLGRFDDPLLNTMLRNDDTELVALLFHELAHQRLYIKDATAFNESFATAVAEFGLRDWLQARGATQSLEERLARQRRTARRMAMIEQARAELRTLYASDMPEADMRAAKRQVYAQLRSQLVAAAPPDSGWNNATLNNAWLATLALYRGYVPAFRTIFALCDSDWSCFYTAVAELAARPAAAREQTLALLADDAP